MTTALANRPFAEQLAYFATKTKIKPENLFIDNRPLHEALARTLPEGFALQGFRALGKSALLSTKARCDLILHTWGAREQKRDALRDLIAEWKEGSLDKSRHELATLIKLILDLHNCENATLTEEIISSGFVNELLTIYYDNDAEYPNADLVNSLIQRDPLGNNFIISILRSPSASAASKRNAMYSIITSANYHDPEVVAQFVHDCAVDLLWTLPWRPDYPMVLHF